MIPTQIDVCQASDKVRHVNPATEKDRVTLTKLQKMQESYRITVRNQGERAMSRTYINLCDSLVSFRSAMDHQTLSMPQPPTIWLWVMGKWYVIHFPSEKLL